MCQISTAAVRLVASLALAAMVIPGCGGSPRSQPVDLSTARAKTIAAGTVRFTLSVAADLGGTRVQSEENGTASFSRRRAHLYKLVPGGGLPREVVVIGPYTYSNANVQAALGDLTVKPWTRLDTRRLSAAQRGGQPDELAHVLAPAYLSDGVANAKRVGSADDGTTRFTGRVDPARLARRVPAVIMAAVRNDYANRPFKASFWLDENGRIRRVRVAYETNRGSTITVDARYSDFGSGVDVTLPRADKIQDISPS
jgi:hypothetical protein